MTTPHLHLVGPDDTARVALTPRAADELDKAELFLLSLETEMATDGPRVAYLLGLAEGHLANLIQRLREVTL
jgi:hypothetical protein